MANAGISAAQADDIRRFVGEGVHDSEIARRMGLGVSTIIRNRTKMGLAKAPAPRRPCPHKFVVTPAQINELRTTSDRAMERKYGHNKDVWRRARNENGIPRFRQPTIVNGAPAPWKPKRVQETGPSWGFPWKSPDPKRDHSLAGEAATYLRMQRFPNVYNRFKVHGEPGWQCGRSVLSEAELIAKAERFGFKREGWMA